MPLISVLKRDGFFDGKCDAILKKAKEFKLDDLWILIPVRMTFLSEKLLHVMFTYDSDKRPSIEEIASFSNYLYDSLSCPVMLHNRFGMQERALFVPFEKEVVDTCFLNAVPIKELASDVPLIEQKVSPPSFLVKTVDDLKVHSVSSSSFHLSQKKPIELSALGIDTSTRSIKERLEAADPVATRSTVEVDEKKIEITVDEKKTEVTAVSLLPKKACIVTKLAQTQDPSAKVYIREDASVSAKRISPASSNSSNSKAICPTELEEPHSSKEKRQRTHIKEEENSPEDSSELLDSDLFARSST